MYSIVRRSYQPGTRNVMKQILENCLAIFCFLVRAYNHDDDVLATIEEELARRGQCFEQLHDAFYKLFMDGYCVG